MIIDKENLLSYKQAITVTADSSSVLDLGAPMWTKTSGNDRDIDMFMSVDELFTAAGAATLTIDIKTSSTEDFSADVDTVWSKTIPKASLTTTGKQPLGIHIPPDTKRYVKAVYTVAMGPFTAGKLTIGVTASRQTNS